MNAEERWAQFRQEWDSYVLVADMKEAFLRHIREAEDAARKDLMDLLELASDGDFASVQRQYERRKSEIIEAAEKRGAEAKRKEIDDELVLYCERHPSKGLKAVVDDLRTLKSLQPPAPEVPEWCRKAARRLRLERREHWPHLLPNEDEEAAIIYQEWLKSQEGR